MIKYIFMWLHSYVHINYFDYLELIKYFKSVQKIYDFSFYEFEFKQFIFSNNIKISNDKINNLCNYSLKKVSKKMFDILNSNKIVILTIDSINFPININKFFNYDNLPIVIYAKGNLLNLDKVKVSVYYDNNFSEYGFKLYYDFCNYLNFNNISIVSDYLSQNVSIFLVNYILNDSYILDDNLLVLSCNLTNNNYENINILFNISNNLLILESSYNYKAVILTDFMLENNSNIYVVPGNIYNKNSYFSNYLLSLGAFVVTSKYNFLKCLEGKND